MENLPVKNIIIGSSTIIIPFIFIVASIRYSPWFSWSRNALSDLGHATRSSVAPLFNLGLLTGGALLIVYAITRLSKVFPRTSYAICLIGFSTQLVAVFDEVYGILHFAAAIATFLSVILATLIYATESGEKWPIPVLLLGLSSWIAYYNRIIKCGPAVPEALFSIAASCWYVKMVYRTAVETPVEETDQSRHQLRT